MRLREGGTALIGFVLCSAILTSAVTQDIPLDFFISPETGEPNAVIVVGSKAATEDVISATELAAALGSLYTRISGITFGERFRAVHVPDSSLYESWENDALSLNYTLQSLWHFDDPNAFWSCNDGAFQPWETHEEIQIRFDPNTNVTTARSYCVPCLYGGDAAHLKSVEDQNLSGGHKIPGLIYRVDNIFVPPSVIVEMWFGIHHRMRGRGPRIFTVPEPWMVVRGMLPQFKFFGTLYTVVDAGPVMEMNSRTGELGELYGTPYMVTGNPHFETQIVLYLNNPSEFGLHTVELVDVEQSKAFFEVSCNGKPVGSFWLIPDAVDGFAPDLQGELPFDHYDVCNDLNSNGKLDAGEAINIISMDDEDNEGGVFDKWIVDRLEKDVWVDYRWEYYTDDHDDVWGLFTVADFVIDGVRVFTDDQGDGVEIQVYWLENEKVWYNHLCSDPWTAESHDYLLFLDAYQAGWDEIKGNSYLYQPPGTGLWPSAGLDLWNNTVSNSIFIGNGFLDTNDGHIGYEYYLGLSEGYFPEQNDFDRDKGTTNDCRNAAWILQENCQNQHDIEDPVGFNGAGPIVVELNACLCHGMCAPCSSRHGSYQVPT